LGSEILAGKVDSASGGITPLLTILGKTRGSIGVKGVYKPAVRICFAL
jgi:hypothetical protein